MKGRAVPDIPAKQTVYNGYRFRSRLEARHAVLMDTAGIEYVYEPQTYDLGNGRAYLPDFWIPHLDCFVEIKGADASPQDDMKMILLAAISGKQVYCFTGDIEMPEDSWGGTHWGAEAFIPSSAVFGDVAAGWDSRGQSPLAVLSPNTVACLFEFDMACWGALREIPYTLHPRVTVKHLRRHLPADKWQEVASKLSLEGHESYSFSIGGGHDVNYWWCQCPVCGMVGIEYEGRAERINCPCTPKGHKEYSANTELLIKAYTAARQARFEHGESGAPR